MLIPIGILGNALGISGGLILIFFGYAYISFYYLREINYSYPSEKPSIIIVQMILLALASLVLLTKYFLIPYGDYPGLVVLPLFFLTSGYMILKYSRYYKKIGITSILFIILAIPVIHPNTFIEARGYIPASWFNPNILINKIFIEMIWEFKTSEAEVITNDAINLRNKGFSGEAYKKLLQAQEIEPDNARIKFELSTIYAGAKEFKSAIEYLEKAIELAPDESAFYNNIGLYNYKISNHKTALSYLEKALELEPTLKSVHYNLALVLTALNQYQRACHHIEKCMQADFNIDEKILLKIKREYCK